MKKPKIELTLLLILFCVLLAAVPAFAMENISEGFRGIPWGTAPPEENSAEGNEWGLEKQGNEGSVILYLRSEKVSVAGVEISSPVNYIFHDKTGFACAIIQFSGQENYEVILNVCAGYWGEPDSKMQEENQKFGGNGMTNLWIGNNIFILLNYNYGTQADGVLSFVTSDYVKYGAKLQ